MVRRSFVTPCGQGKKIVNLQKFISFYELKHLHVYELPVLSNSLQQANIKTDRYINGLAYKIVY